MKCAIKMNLTCLDGKAEFSASLLQSSVSHDPSEIILICLFAAHISCYFQCWKPLYFCGSHDTFSPDNFDEIESSKGQHVFFLFF